jgi:8-oxo-dGTP pyrophosphatase MutT (NUDIX family)
MSSPLTDPAASAAATIAPAATVLVLRESCAGALEVLMTKRAAGLSFMGGLWVFPGGRMETADCSAAISDRAALPDVRSARHRMLDTRGAPVPPERALGLHVAACRETFEEAGVLLARRRFEPSPLDPGQLARIAAFRETGSPADAFVRLLQAEDLLLEVERLVYWSHWITPSLERRRFDTRFFAVRVPDGQQASVDRSESTHHAWLGEHEVRSNLGTGEMKMAPPTIATLEDLWLSHAQHGGLDGMLEAERTRAVPPILPKIVRGHGDVEVVLPWDPWYAELPGEACVVWPTYPPYLAALPSRRALAL